MCMKFFCNLHSFTESLSPERAWVLAIIISVFAALLMIVSSYILNNTQYAENSQKVTWVIMSIWWFPFYGLTRRSGAEWKIKK